MTRLLMAVATGLGLGRLPLPAAVAAALAALPLRLLADGLAPGHSLTLAAVIFLLGFFAAGTAEKMLEQADAPEIVIDEVAGLLAALVWAPPQPAAWLAGLLFFWLFTAVKPWPAGWVARHLHGGLAVMLDDLVAGLYAFCCLQLLWRSGLAWSSPL